MFEDVEWSERVPEGTLLYWDASHRTVLARNRDGTFREVGKAIRPDAEPAADTPVEVPAP